MTRMAVFRERAKCRAQRVVGLSVIAALMALTGCSTQAVGALASVALGSSPLTAAQERAELNSLAVNSAVAEKSPEMETATSYLQVIAQIQRKQLWFASLAHLDALEAKWGATDDSRLLRADALRQVGMGADSTRLYEQLLASSQSARARHGLGLLAAHEGRYDEAVNQLQAARTATPTDALLLNDLAYALMHTAQAASARIPIMQAAQLQPSHPRIQSNVALFLVLHGSGEQASDWMRQHQMGEAMRLQVFTQAQRLASMASMASVAVPTGTQRPADMQPQTPETSSADGSVMSSTDVQRMAALSSEHAANGMTETPQQGVRP